MEIHVLDWNRHKNVVCLNRFMGSQPSLLIIGIQIYTNNEKPAKIGFYSKRPHTITKMNDNINMDSTTAGL
jgi:hypothetical protein